MEVKAKPLLPTDDHKEPSRVREADSVLSIDERIAKGSVDIFVVDLIVPL